MKIDHLENAIKNILAVTHDVREVMKIKGLPDEAVKQLRFIMLGLKDAHMDVCSYMFAIHASELTPRDLAKLPAIKEQNDVSENKELYDGNDGNIIRFSQQESTGNDEEK